MKKYLKTFAILLISTVIFFYFKYLRRTPYSILNKEGITLRKDIANKIVEYEDDWGGFFNIHGDGRVIIDMIVSRSIYNDAIKNINFVKYKKLPILEKDYDNIPYRFIKEASVKGYYSISKISSDGYLFILLDDSNNRIIYYYEIH